MAFPRLPEPVALELERIVQEALANSRRHSGAWGRGELEADEDEIEVVVSDDGRGFEPDRAGAGVGLTSMKERASLIGGYLKIRSECRRAREYASGCRATPDANGRQPSVETEAHYGGETRPGPYR